MTLAEFKRRTTPQPTPPPTPPPEPIDFSKLKTPADYLAVKERAFREAEEARRAKRRK
jgi:hypothetical protein